MNQLLIMAGGKGSRMKSELPKVLLPFHGRPMLEGIIERLKESFPHPGVIVGYRGDEVRSALGQKAEYFIQAEPRGTGDAVMAARTLAERPGIETVLVIPGDHPLTTAKTLHGLMEAQRDARAVMTVATAKPPSFDGIYSHFQAHGRIIRDAEGRVERIVEQKDARPAEQEVTEVNTSMYCFDHAWLWANIGRITNVNAAGEYYLTDMVAMAAAEGRLASYVLPDAHEAFGANTPEELHFLEGLSQG